jgi:hypothetical protein
MKTVRKMRKMMYRKSTLIRYLKGREEALPQRRQGKLSPTRGMSWRKMLSDLKIRSQSSSAPFPFFSSSPPLAWFSSHSRSLPPLDPGTLPNSYITLGKTLNDAPLAVRDLDAERVMESSSSLSAPAPPVPPPELTKSGKPLTKKEKKAVGRSQVILLTHPRTNALVS